MVMIVLLMVAGCGRSASAGAGVRLLPVSVFLLYHISRQAISYPTSISVLVLLGILRLLMIPAFGEILRQWYADVSARPPLSGTHYGLERHQGARVANRSAAVGESAYGLVTHLAGSIRLLYVGRAATEEQANNGKGYARQSRQKPPRTRIQFAPIPGGEINGQAPLSDSTSVAMRRTIT